MILSFSNFMFSKTNKQTNKLRTSATFWLHFGKSLFCKCLLRTAPTNTNYVLLVRSSSLEIAPWCSVWVVRTLMVRQIWFLSDFWNSVRTDWFHIQSANFWMTNGFEECGSHFGFEPLAYPKVRTCMSEPIGSNRIPKIRDEPNLSNHQSANHLDRTSRCDLEVRNPHQQHVHLYIHLRTILCICTS